MKDEKPDSMGVHEVTRFELQLLQAARSESVPEKLRERAFAALAGASAGGGPSHGDPSGGSEPGPSAALGAALKVSSAATWSKALTAGTVALVLTTGAMLSQHAPVHHMQVGTPLTRIASSPSTAPVIPEAPPPADSREAGRTSRSVDAAVNASGSTRSAKIDEAQRRTHELLLVDEARSALAAGQATTALQILAQHRREFPTSSFDVERDTLRVDALQASGHPEQARRFAEEFVREHPDSPQAARMRSLVHE